MARKYKRNKSKRKYARKVRRSRRPTALPYFKQKLTTVVSVSPTGTLPQLLGFALQQTTNQNNTGVVGFDSAPRWLQVYKNYESYAVTGLKLKYIPANFSGARSYATTGTLINGTGSIDSVAHTISINPIYLYFDIDTYNATQYSLQQIVGLDKMWIIDPTRSYSKYFSCKGISKSENVSWQDTKSWVQNMPNTLTNASATFFVQGSHLSTDTHHYGFIKCTWYVTFRGQATL